MLLGAAREVGVEVEIDRERELFIGTQFSILYTSMYSPAEAATLLSVRNYDRETCLHVAVDNGNLEVYAEIRRY
jgi:hypothetical protein